MYSYEFKDKKTAYVGLTRRSDKRIKYHTRGYSTHGKHSAVYKFAQDNNIEISEENYIVKETNLTAEKA